MTFLLTVAIGGCQPQNSPHSASNVRRLEISISSRGIPKTFQTADAAAIAKVYEIMAPSFDAVISESKGRPRVSLDYIDFVPYDKDGKVIEADKWSVAVEGRKAGDPLIPTLERIEKFAGVNSKFHGDDLPLDKASN